MALVTLVPVLAVDPGVVTSDTKTYLYLDPSRFLQQVTSMWYPTVALGTVTHQYVGYLLPMGPYYALCAAAHVPVWVAQRLWLGLILFAAGTGVAYLCRVLGVGGPGRLAASFTYLLSPYVLQYAGRISVLLLPWAALGWLTALVVLAVRRGGWRYPALFALAVAVSSSINASCILYVLIAPALWLVWAVAVEREIDWRGALGVAARCGVLTLCCCAWWIVGLVVEAGYGVDILKYTESVSATSSTSSTTEVLRGLGYWFFYGGSKTGPWTTSSGPYTQWLWLLAVSWLLPVAAFASAALVRWRHRSYFVILTVLGVVLSVGAFPYSHPTVLGGALKAFMNDTTAGLALRSTDRATPVALLGIAMLVGAGVAAVAARTRAAGLGTGALVCAVALANNPALFTGDAEVAARDTQPASLPSYELAAIHHLDGTHPGTRVLAVPGEGFGNFTWGYTVDTPQPGLLTRPFAIREQQVMGSMATADTLYATEAAIQTDIENWSSLAPMARLLSAGDVLVEYDQTATSAGSPPAAALAHDLAQTPKGLTGEESFGAAGQGVAPPTPGPQALALPTGTSEPAPDATYSVTDPRPLVRAESDTGALIVAGNATGLESLAGQGLLDTGSAIYYAGTLDSRPAQLAKLLAGGATLVVTDSNRKEGFRWNTIDDNYGFIETASDATATTTPSDAPIDLFPDAPTDAQTLATFLGAANVTASSFGNTISYTPQDRPSNAVDGTLKTAWETGAYTADVDGQWWQLSYRHPVTAAQVTLVQPLDAHAKRSITKVTLTFTGKDPVTVDLGSGSRQRTGQVVRFGRRRFSTLRVTIDGTSRQVAAPVGLAEVELPGQHVEEVDQLPTDLLADAGAASLSHRLIISMTRERVSQFSVGADPEVNLSRSFTLPTARTFTISGTATLTRRLHDDQVAALVGVPGATGAGTVATSSSHLTGDLRASAGAAADGNPATAWQPALGAGNQIGSWLDYDLAAPDSFDSMTLQVVADRDHSVPAAVTLTVSTPDTGASRSVQLTLPPVARSATPGHTVTIPLRFATMTGRDIRVSFTRVHLHTAPTATPTSSHPSALPIGIAEVGIPGVAVAPAPTDLPGVCRSDLLAVDGHPVTVEVVGPTAVATGGGAVALRGCGADAGGLHLAAGHHVVETALGTTPSAIGLGCPTGGRCGGWTVDALTFDSAAGGAPASQPAPTPSTTPAGTLALRAPTPGPAPTVGVPHATSTTESLSVAGAVDPFELVLGESLNSGWRAVAHPASGAGAGARSVTLGDPELVDAFANGWPVSAADLSALGATRNGGRFTVSLVWTPQAEVVAGMAVSAAAIALCLLFVLPPRATASLRRLAGGRTLRRRRRPRPMAAAVTSPDRAVRAPPVSWTTVAVASVVTGLAAAAITVPWAGIGAAVAVAAGLRVRRARVLAGLVAVVLLVAAAAVIVISQGVSPLPEGGNWPGAYSGAASVASAAVAFLGAGVVVDLLHRRVRAPD